MSIDSQTEEMRNGARALCVQVVFHIDDDRQAQSAAARMIDSAHQIANLPECECDVDVSVELIQPDGARSPLATGGTPSRVRPVKQ
ncbi:MAG TPA: hypothetical protein VIJ33_00625 [Solirubrobacteraceae bacterium]